MREKSGTMRVCEVADPQNEAKIYKSIAKHNAFTLYRVSIEDRRRNGASKDAERKRDGSRYGEIEMRV